ncbi:hypothetical protein FK531_09185 [Rhodococcus spelaei]|uniref:DUF8020 domain-containing protein n=1 Tax=Rhodococcus spelaei TaxID=2546320 RepID=A0A541BMX9_9NOCA|nr:hypothetical protein [Rhodococcus spelaei]TQF73634.1 hypothetical protein FK531_09185 [Rhodococcus spelaei]
MAPDGRSARATLDGAAFKVDPSGWSVDVVNDTGTTLVSLPLLYPANGDVYRLTPDIENGGGQLTLTPDTVPMSVEPGTRNVDKPTRDEAYRNLVYQAEVGWAAGGWMGAAVAGAIAGPICITVVGCVVPLTAAAIGAYVGISMFNPNFQPAVDAFMSTF